MRHYCNDWAPSGEPTCRPVADRNSTVNWASERCNGPGAFPFSNLMKLVIALDGNVHGVTATSRYLANAMGWSVRWRWKHRCGGIQHHSSTRHWIAYMGASSNNNWVAGCSGSRWHLPLWMYAHGVQDAVSVRAWGWDATRNLLLIRNAIILQILMIDDWPVCLFVLRKVRLAHLFAF